MWWVVYFVTALITFGVSVWLQVRAGEMASNDRVFGGYVIALMCAIACPAVIPAYLLSEAIKYLAVLVITINEMIVESSHAAKVKLDAERQAAREARRLEGWQ
jgi:hypothetical protein